jgi:ABC-type transporter Mla maintaining outer membrane lipid asymmetry ATPase subunit MlaF
MDRQTPHTPSERVIEMVNVDVAAFDAPTTLAIGAVNWQVSSGDYWVIAGLHNSGKTDFLAMTAGLVPPLQGTFRLFGHEATQEAEDALLADRLRMGLVFERGARLFHHLTVAQNIFLAVRYHKNWSDEQAQGYLSPLIDLLELSDWLDFAPRRLSLKWRQRVGLARALALKPELLLLDNPVAGLDPRETSWWIDTLTQLSVGQHPWMPGTAVTLTVTCDNVHPWMTQGKQFARLRDKRWEVLGPRDQLSQRGGDPLSEFLEKDFIRS